VSGHHTADLGRHVRGICHRMSDRVGAVRVLAFDVNETLLDLSALDSHFEAVFGSAALRGQWFSQMLQLAFVGAITDRYLDFTSAQHAALNMVAQREGIELSGAAARRIVDGMRELPPHADVPDALDRLRAGGLTLSALTNSPLDVARDQLRNAGLDERFHAILSADQVRELKPRREPYELVARTFDVSPGQVRLVAAHSWDVTGALAAGCRAAFVARPGMVLSPIGERPDVVGGDVGEIADQILEQASATQ
jgi:2-haloacid dehalogenase